MCRIWLILSIVAMALVGGDRANGQPVGGDDPAVKAARLRQESTKTVNIKFKRTDIDPIGAVSERSAGMFKSANPVPDRETTTESINRLVIDGPKVRYENNHPRWYMPKGILQYGAFVGSSDTALAKEFFPKGVSGEAPPFGSIEKGGVLPFVQSHELVPLTFTFRGLDPAISPYPIAEAKPTGLALPIDGAKCLEYLFDGSVLRTSFWLDPARDYLARRVQVNSEGRLQKQWDVSYRADANANWAPVSWVEHSYSAGGKLQTTTSVEILEAKLDEKQHAEEFALTFPPGTQVFDHRSQKNFRVQSDGSLRELSPTGAETGPSIPQSSSRWYLRYKWLLAGAAVVLVVALLTICARRRSRRLPQT